MKKKLLLLAILLIGVPALLRAQEEEDWSIPVSYSGQRPAITDFVSAILSEEDLGESLGEMKDNWDLHLAGKALPEGRSFLIDSRNGYLRYDATDESDGEVYKRYIEFCFWNCRDGRHKLIAENTVCSQAGVPYMGQYSGVSFYLYDGKTRRMEPAYADDLGLDPDYPDGMEVLVHQLPRIGKTIKFLFYTTSETISKSFTWNGNKFVEEAE